MTFKQLFNAHQQSMCHKKYQHSMALSKHVWSQKEKKESYSIKWSRHQKAVTYQNTKKMCNLCLIEKRAIINADKKIIKQMNRTGLEVPP